MEDTIIITDIYEGPDRQFYKVILACRKYPSGKREKPLRYRYKYQKSRVKFKVDYINCKSTCVEISIVKSTSVYVDNEIKSIGYIIDLIERKLQKEPEPSPEEFLMMLKRI